MASSRRPTKPRRCAPKAAKATPAAARPSTSKPRAHGKPRPVFGRLLLDVQRRLDEAAAERDRLQKWISTANQVTQLACKRLRSALGPLGQGADDRSTTGHMLAMIEELIEQRNFAGHFERVAHESIIRMRSALGEVVRAAGLHQAIPDDLASITGRMIEALKQASSQNQGTVGLDDPLPPMQPGDSIRMLCEGHTVTLTATLEQGIHSGRPRFNVRCDTCKIEIHSATTGPRSMILGHLREANEDAASGEAKQLPFRVKLGEPTVVRGTVVQWRSPQPADATTTELEPDMHNGPCEDLDGSGACFGCGRWLGAAPTSDAAPPKDPTGGTP